VALETGNGRRNEKSITIYTIFVDNILKGNDFSSLSKNVSNLKIIRYRKPYNFFKISFRAID
jgi:hypothetical protein